MATEGWSHQPARLVVELQHQRDRMQDVRLAGLIDLLAVHAQGDDRLGQAHTRRAGPIVAPLVFRFAGEAMLLARARAPRWSHESTRVENPS